MEILKRKGVYPCEYMDDWNRFDEEKLPGKTAFHSSLNKEKYQILIIGMLRKYLINLILKI